MTTSTPALALPNPATPIVSISPVVLTVPDRLTPIEVRLSAPLRGDGLPILLLSHGHGPSNYVSSLYGYAPLANYFAAHGFLVIQPTHLDSKTLSFRASNHPDAPLFWRSRAEDMSRILDALDTIERALPTLSGRVDHDKVAILGHSMGGHTASLLLGAQHTGHGSAPSVSLADPRIKAGVLLAAPGRGSTLRKDLPKSYSFFETIDFRSMTTPALVVAGDADAAAHLTTAGPSWFADPYLLSPGPKALLTLFGAGHSLGGVSGYDVGETTDESPERVATVQRLAGAYLRAQLLGGAEWEQACRALAAAAEPLGRVETK